MIFRLSQKLNAKIKAGVLPTLAADKNPIVDWSAHLFVAGRTKYILLSNTESLYSTVMFGKGITNEIKFVESALSSIREFLERDGQKSVYDRLIGPETGTISFAKALNRSVTGSMTEMIRFATVFLVEDESPHDVGFKLNEIPFSWLKHGTPRKTFMKMVGER